MNINNIDFPNQILDAIQESKLVVFAGAGASIDAPTSLPNFENLAKIIAEGTGRTLPPTESCETFLGALKANGIDVNERAANILSGACLKHNALHEAIVDLFSSPASVKIVTTNYDQMFEQVLEEKKIPVPIYNSPALPLGNDILGIVHIHGNVNNPQYMVLTDEDFGKAYMTEGYVSRFLVRLFESYTVLFVGYGYHDIILKYLTRAMFRENSANRYILTCDKKSNWKVLGISAIMFPEGKFDLMKNGLVQLSNYAKKGLLDWKNQFLEIADNPPKDLTIETEVDYCLENEYRSRVLSSCIHGVGWLELLDKKDVFACCFSDSIPVNKKGEIWANWLCEEFVGNDDKSLINLFAKHGNHYSSYFAELLFSSIISKENYLDDLFLKQYLTLLDQCWIDFWKLFRLISISHKRHHDHLSLHLFEKQFSTSIELKNSIWGLGESLKPAHSFTGEYYYIKQTWDLINGDVLPKYASEVVAFVIKKVEDVHYLYENIGDASRENEPLSMSMIVVEDRNVKYRNDPIYVLIQAFLQAIEVIEKHDESRYYLKRGVNSESLLLRNIALRAIRESNCFSNDEKIEIICDEGLVWFWGSKEQVFNLAKEAFTKASSKNQNRLLNIIENGPADAVNMEERHKQYAIYNWCVWLQQADPANKRIETIIKHILNDYNFILREHPNLNIANSDFKWVADKSPVSIQEMLEMPVEKLIPMLMNYNGDTFEGPTKIDLLDTFSECVKTNSQWAKDITDLIYAQQINDAELWHHLFQGLEGASLTVEEALSWCVWFSNKMDVIPDIQGVAHFLWKVLQIEEMPNKFKEHEKVLFDLSLALWNRRDTTNPSQMKLIVKALNTVTGTVLMCWIYMTNYSNNTVLSDPYKTEFEKALQLNTWEQEIAVCIIAGHFNFLCYQDQSWCINHLEPMLTSKNESLYKSAWEGFAYFSGRISKNTADIIVSIFIKAVKNIDWLEKETKDSFIELYLTLLIFVVDKPVLKYIPAFYRSTSEETRIQFVKAINNRLRDMEQAAKSNWWNSWLREYIENRKYNKPVELTDAECSALFMLLPSLDFTVDEAVRILCTRTLPSSIDNQFWYELAEMSNVPEHSHSMEKLLISLLNSIKTLEFWDIESIKKIVDTLKGLEEEEKKQLQEVLLKHGIETTI